MIYKNAYIHNATELCVDDDGSMTWYRMPKNLMDKFDIESAKKMNVCSTGVEVRFVLNGDSATVRMRAVDNGGSTDNSFHIFRGGVQGGYTDMVNVNVGSDERSYVIEKAKNIEILKAMSREANDGFSPEVIRIIFDRGTYKILDISGDIRPPKTEEMPSKTLMCYGSSITHGSNSLDMSHSWASMVSRKLHMDLRNLGMAGSCAMEHDVIDYIASEGEKGNWDMAILELGANVLSWKPDKIRERTSYAITNVAKRNPDKRIFIISPIYGGYDFKGMDIAVIWRKTLEEVVSSLAFDNVTYINGLDLLGKISLLSADEVHPNIYGVEEMEKKLIKIIKESSKL
ncbi:MAG: hypothetical protein IJT23_11245 [Clostridia bacterium]|nr:hypothetical protein [Clostridia bacterium]